MIAQVGDIIVITNKALGGIYGKEYVVISLRVNGVGVNAKRNTPEGGSAWFRHSSYEVVARDDQPYFIHGSRQCSDCNGAGKIQLFTSVVRCACVKEEDEKQ